MQLVLIDPKGIYSTPFPFVDWKNNACTIMLDNQHKILINIG